MIMQHKYICARINYFMGVLTSLSMVEILNLYPSLEHRTNPSSPNPEQALDAFLAFRALDDNFLGRR